MSESEHNRRHYREWDHHRIAWLYAVATTVLAVLAVLSCLQVIASEQPFMTTIGWLALSALTAGGGFTNLNASRRITAELDRSGCHCPPRPLLRGPRRTS
ncbi:hypothetical protein ACQP2U_43320 (plasmid) [Nocardia sp. CA-084685]|uniref:hypothetical protein n=1 Tax=Nocardia sp. CA-084685 TaxID=3239970 RepID=UPI003D96F1E0